MINVLINGRAEQSIHFSDRGLSYGDGLFETIAIQRTVPLLWNEHLQRMRLGAERLAIPFNRATEQAFYRDFKSLMATAANQTQDTILKLTLTRGIGARGYKADPNANVTRIAAISAMPDMSAAQRQGVNLHLCATQLARQPLLAGIKHLNRLEQVIARSEWHDPSITEGIVCDTAGYVVEGCMSNVFWVTDGVLYTPDLSQAGVTGVVRNKLLQLCALSTQVEQRVGDFQLQQLLAADEIFVCNSVFNVLPVTAVISCSSISNFTPVPFTIGTITTTLQQLLQQFYLKENEL